MTETEEPDAETEENKYKKHKGDPRKRRMDSNSNDADSTVVYFTLKSKEVEINTRSALQMLHSAVMVTFTCGTSMKERRVLQFSS